MEFYKKLFCKKAAPANPLASIASELDDRLSRAAALQFSGQNKAALLECDHVLLLNPSAHLAYHIRALAKYVLDDQEGAIDDWKCYDSLRKRLK